MEEPNPPNRQFDLKGDSAGFRSKKSDVFGSLDDIEKSYQSNLAVRSEDEVVEVDPDGSREESISSFDDGGFKRPRSPGHHAQRSALSRRREFRSKAWSRKDDVKWRNKKPDFEENPAKWKRYSLEETSVCGNSQNSRVAFDLIRQLQQRREEGVDGESAPADLGQKVVFSKPETRAQDTDMPQSHGDIRKMQEFNFGVKVPKKKGHRTDRGDGSTKELLSNVTLALEHLDEEEKLNEYADRKINQSDHVLPKGQDESNPSISSEAASANREEKKPDSPSSEDPPIAVGFKKRKGKRNIRHRQDDQDN